jgi:nucleoside-diphosphate-sugar epimerase
MHQTVDWVVGDTMDFVGLQEHLLGVEEVYHCAAKVSFNESDRNEMIRVNIRGTANMVDACLQRKVSRFCFVSSIAALGKTADGSPISEDTPRKTDEVYSAYSVSKFGSELEAWRGIAEGLNTVIVNPGVILGPGLPESGSMLIFKTGMKGIPFYTKATTGYVDVRDVSLACVSLMEKGLFGKRFTLVSENAHNGVVLGAIARECGKKEPRFCAGKGLLQAGVCASSLWGWLTGAPPTLTADTIRSAQKSETYSNARIREALGFKFIPLNQTISDTCRFLNT